ncbi:unnamed protein product [Pedinophyceae sp. YPF-701]|nr:unnamed protein product [Pedinophyceae sp. YPF-701]
MKSSEFYTAIWLNALIGAIVLALFVWLRKIDATHRFYNARLYSTRVHNKPRKLINSVYPWKWIVPLFRITEDEVIDTAGLDAVLLLRAMRFGIYLFAILSFFGLAMLIPVDVTADYVAFVQNQRAINAPGSDELPILEDLDELNMSNVRVGSKRLYAHAAMAWIMTLAVFYLANCFHKDMVALRLRFLATQPPSGSTHAALLRDIPGTRAGTKPVRAVQIIDEVLFFLPGCLKRPILSRADAVVRKMDEVAQEQIRKAKAGMARRSSRKAGLTDCENGECTVELSRKGRLQRALDGEANPALYIGRTQSAAVPALKGDIESGGGGSNTETSQPGSATPPTKFAVVEDPKTGVAKVVKVDDPFKELPRIHDVRAAVDADAETAEFFAYAEARDRPVTFDESVAVPFKTIFGDLVDAVHPVKDFTRAQALLNEFSAIKARAQLTADVYHTTMARQRDIKHKFVKPRGVFGGAAPTCKADAEWLNATYGEKTKPKVESLEFFAARMERLKALLDEERVAVVKKEAPAAFVTFNKRWAAAVAADGMVHPDLRNWTTDPAPEPEDVYWHALRLRGWERFLRSCLVNGTIALAIIFFSIPVGFIQALLAVERWENVVVLKSIVGVDAIRKFLVGFLPGLAMVIVLAVLPPLLALLGKIQGLESFSRIDGFVVSRFFLFQILVVFFMNVGAAAFSEQIDKIFSDPGIIPDLLANNVPSASDFFLSYTLVRGVLQPCLKLLNVPKLAIYLLRLKFAPTERAKQAVIESSNRKLGPVLPVLTMAFFLGLVYAPLNALMCVVTLIFFCMHFIVLKYQTVFIDHGTYETGGRLWPTIFNQIMISLLFGQLVTLGVLGLNEAGGAASMCIPLPIMAAAFWYYQTKLYAKPLSILSLRTCMDLDEVQRVDRNLEAGGKVLRDGFFRHPALNITHDDCDAVIAECKECLEHVREYERMRSPDYEEDTNAETYNAAEKDDALEQRREARTDGDDSA